MATRDAFFAVERGATGRRELAAALRALVDGMHERPPELFAWIEEEAPAKGAGSPGAPSPSAQGRSSSLRWFGFFGSVGGTVDRELATSLLAAAVPTLVVVLHDDVDGRYLFELREGGASTLKILSDGHRVGVARGRVETDYPQKPFSPDALDRLATLPSEELDANHARALMEYMNAAEIGLREKFPGELSGPEGALARRYVAARGRAETWQLVGLGRVVEPFAAVERPAADDPRYASLVDFRPSDEEWAQAGIVPHA